MARRRGARLAAVQALYQMELSGRGADAVVREFQDCRFEIDDRGDAGADEDHFADVVRGAATGQEDIDKAIKAVLSKSWRLSRLDATARAILRAGGYELLHRTDIPHAVVIDEYVDIAHAFFEGDEPGFVNGALDAISKGSAGREVNAEPPEEQGDS